MDCGLAHGYGQTSVTVQVTVKARGQDEEKEEVGAQTKSSLPRESPATGVEQPGESRLSALWHVPRSKRSSRSLPMRGSRTMRKMDGWFGRTTPLQIGVSSNAWLWDLLTPHIHWCSLL